MLSELIYNVQFCCWKQKRKFDGGYASGMIGRYLRVTRGKPLHHKLQRQYLEGEDHTTTHYGFRKCIYQFEKSQLVFPELQITEVFFVEDAFIHSAFVCGC